MCAPPADGGVHRDIEGATAFTRTWIDFEQCQHEDACLARARFLDRYEWPSVWETEEVQGRLCGMWAAESTEAELDPEHCHDKDKPRATMTQYVALVGEEVAVNLEGIARARLEKRPRQYQSDAAVHQAYMRATTGGGQAADGDDDGEGEPAAGGPKEVGTHLLPIPWDIRSETDMRAVLNFAHRLRLTPYAKELVVV